MADKFLNKSFLRALLFRRCSFSALGSIPQRFSFPGQGPLIDFLGVNYYGRMIVSASVKPPFVKIQENPNAEQKTDVGWEMYPSGLHRVFAEWKTLAPDIPIMITENGAADVHDRVRSSFLIDHVKTLKIAAKQTSVRLLGYIHWSLTDNFEWSEGLEPRFGLVQVNYPVSANAKDLSFEKRPAFFTYQKIIKDSQNNPSI